MYIKCTVYTKILDMPPLKKSLIKSQIKSLMIGMPIKV